MLDESQRERLLRLFAEGADLPPSERAAFVEQAGGDDPAVQRELRDLLFLADSDLDDFLTEPAAVIPDSLTAAAASSPARSTSGGGVHTTPLPEIDGYTDFEHVAEGGMGTVYRALQLHPVRRTVAIKIIRPGMDTTAVLARFAVERQTLALMSHPYIAAVHDAGTDTMGRPFIAMEFVDGRPMSTFCEEERLTLDQRLELFVKVCHAVDHAHRRGVLHRDLKPSNVLVAQTGDEALPKVIDFGIAKAMQGPLGDLSILTVEGTFLGTPEYMSPEQISGASDRVDTRSDVYSLGVMLYELVTHVRPIDPARLRELGLTRLSEVTRDGPPPKPSTRLRELLAEQLERASSSPPHTTWLHRVRGDLDWVVMKAIESEPDRRYGSPHELATDIGNFLAHRPVLAGPPTGLYRLRKFAQRYRLQVTAAALVLLALVLGLFGTFWFLLEAKANEASANARAAEAIAASREAEGIRIAAEAAMLAVDSPNVALLLALEASKLTDGNAVKQTIHRILPNHCDVTILDGHDYDVRQLVFLDDERLLSRGYDPTVLLWDSKSGALLRRFTGHTDVVESMAFDAASRRLLTASRDGTSRVWDIDSGACVLQTSDHAAPLTFGTFAADGTRFATASVDGTARVFDARSGARRFVLDGQGGEVRSVVFDPSGTRIATRSVDAVTRVWSGVTGALELELPAGSFGHQDEVLQEAMFSPRGDRIVSFDGRVGERAHVLIDAIDGTRLLDLLDARFPRFLADDRLLVTTGRGRAFVDLQTGAVTERQDSSDVGLILEPAADGNFAVALDLREDICTVDLHSGSLLRRFHGYSDKRWSYLDVAFHPDGERFAVTGSRVRVLTTKPEFAPFDLPLGESDVVSFDLNAADTALVLVAAFDGRRTAGARPTWRLWNLDDGQLLTSIEHPELRSLQISPTGTELIGITQGDEPSASGSPPRVVVFDLGGRPLRDFPIAPELGYFAVRPDGRVLATTDADEAAVTSIAFWDLETGELLRTIPGPNRAFRWTDAATMDRLIVSYGGLRRTEVLDSLTGDLVARVRGPGNGGHWPGVISPNGRYLLVTLYSLRAVVWDLSADLDAQDAAPIAEYTDLVRSNTATCGFARNGELAWVMCANEVHIFETLTGRTFSVLRLDARCAATTASRDGTALITVTREGRCQRWPLDPIAVARRLAVGRLSANELKQHRIGTPSEWRARERDDLLGNPTPRHWSRLADLALQDNDLDGAIDCLLHSYDLGPLAPTDVDIYLRLFELRCRRLGLQTESDAERAAELDAALAALEQAMRCGATPDQISSLPGTDPVASLPRFRQALQR